MKIIDRQMLLDEIAAEAAAWDAFLDEVGEERMEEPGATGEWTFKDVVAHLSGWRKRTIARLEAARNDMTPTLNFWPAEWDEEEDVNKINAWIYEENHARPLREVLDESRSQFSQIYALVQTMPAERLFTPARFGWTNGRPLADYVDFGHFHDEHEATLRQWLAVAVE